MNVQSYSKNCKLFSQNQFTCNININLISVNIYIVVHTKSISISFQFNSISINIYSSINSISFQRNCNLFATKKIQATNMCCKLIHKYSNHKYHFNHYICSIQELLNIYTVQGKLTQNLSINRHFK